MPRGAAWGEARSANAKCRRQNAKSGDGGIEVRPVGDDVFGVPINAKSGDGANEAQTVGDDVLGVPINAKSGDGGIEARSVGDDVHGVPINTKSKLRNEIKVLVLLSFFALKYEQTVNERNFQIFTLKIEKYEKMKIIFKKRQENLYTL